MPSSSLDFFRVLNDQIVKKIPINTTINPGITYNSPLEALAAKIVKTNICPTKGTFIIIGALSLAVSPRSPAVQAPVNPECDKDPAIPGARIPTLLDFPKNTRRATPTNIQKS